MGATDHLGRPAVTYEEAADLLGLTRRVLRRRVAGGFLEVVKVKGDARRFITLQSVEDYRDSRGISLREVSRRLFELERQVRDLKLALRRSGGIKGIEEGGFDREAFQDLVGRYHSE